MNYDPIYRAIEDDDAQQVSKLLREEKASGLTIDPSDQIYLLVHAVEMDSTACLRALFAECDPTLANAVATSGGEKGETTLLGLAVDDENVGMLRVLLKYCDPRWQSKNGETVLMRAVKEKDNPNLDAMLKRLLPVSDLNQCDHSGKTALDHAALALSPKAIRRLISMGDALNTKSCAGENALMQALSKESDEPGKMKCVRLLMTVCDPAQVNPRNGRTALLGAMENDDLAAIQLMSTFCDVNQQDDQGDTALIIASEHGDAQSIKLLLPLSDCTLRNKAGRDALMSACDALSRTADEELLEVLSASPRELKEKHAQLLSTSIMQAHDLRLVDPFFAENSPRFMEVVARFEHEELVESLKKAHQPGPAVSEEEAGVSAPSISSVGAGRGRGMKSRRL